MSLPSYQVSSMSDNNYSNSHLPRDFMTKKNKRTNKKQKNKQNSQAKQKKQKKTKQKTTTTKTKRKETKTSRYAVSIIFLLPTNDCAYSS
jgi:alpha-galactosidase/6-phospho-beta-glucosidase family protein